MPSELATPVTVDNQTVHTHNPASVGEAEKIPYQNLRIDYLNNIIILSRLTLNANRLPIFQQFILYLN